ncbi:X-Pro dipeptidyl-peptidase-domain-containing protein [Massariosphaeria phaeospora]|uniref:X-Pro dipeptidyl-peptidase-domain-containing protein n=1 Tax=Massariosphaeria phaeospora TaxID=100035 RepID=A0A7C8I9Q0_9PLEO|nr:X-Pro dipeptidyl-peptidase-domain-containing protein [Massariosphaeria phaeospora]
MPTQHRGLLLRLLDRTASWLIGFPPERCNFTTCGVRIPISSGLSRIELAADLLQPTLADGTKPLGTVLIRSPYGRGLAIGITPRAYAARGYQVLFVSCRGTFGSGGEFDAFRTEGEDGKAVMEWMRAQPWYTGTFATCGGSYLGFVQWALLCDDEPPADLVAAVPGVAPHDFARATWGTGALDLDIVRFADMVGHQEEPFAPWQAVTGSRKRRFEAVLHSHSVSLAPNLRTYLGEKSPWVDNMLAKPDIRDPHYAPMRLQRALERTETPILIITGWYDLFLQQSMEQYMRLRERGCNVALTVGPWTHMKSAVAAPMNRQAFDWIEQHLGGSTQAQRTAAVQYFVTGAQEWRNIAEYPPPTTPSTFHLHPGGELSNEPISTEAEPASSTFTFDPQDPTPTIGGNGLHLGGSVNDTALARRSDVLVFDTAPLEADLEFCGQPLVALAHSTNSRFANIFVRVSEVNAKGQSRNVTEAFARLDAQRGEASDDRLSLALNHCSHRFERGTRIRVVVAGGNFPQYARNCGVENGGDEDSDMCAVEHTVRYCGPGGSNIVFPVVEAHEEGSEIAV